MGIGTDMVFIPRFERLMENEQFMRKVFDSSECEEYDAEHLAGVFAAKEDFSKAIGSRLDWLKVEVRKQRAGRPVLAVDLDGIGATDVSISHDKDYATATVIIKNVE